MFVLLLFLLFCFLCSTSLVNVRGFYTEGEPLKFTTVLRVSLSFFPLRNCGELLVAGGEGSDIFERF